MTLDLSHLTAPTRELAFQDAKARIRLVQTARWVGYPRAGVAVEEFMEPVEAAPVRVIGEPARLAVPGAVACRIRREECR